MARKLKVLPLKFLGFLSLQGIVAIIGKDVATAWSSLDFLNNIIGQIYH